MTFRATDRTAYLTNSTMPNRDQSATWPTAAELERLSIEPQVGASIQCTHGCHSELGEFFATEERDTLRVFSAPDRHDTIPSPPPELESAPWHD